MLTLYAPHGIIVLEREVNNMNKIAYDKTRLGIGERYYFVDLLGVKVAYDDYTEIDNLRFDRGNYFIDVSEAETMLETLLLRLRGE